LFTIIVEKALPSVRRCVYIMKFIVWEKPYKRRFANWVVVNILIVPITLTMVYAYTFSDFDFPSMLAFVILFFGLNTSFYLTAWQEGSEIVFEEDVIKCIFLKKIRKAIYYRDVKEYGVFTAITANPSDTQKFIYISRVELPENQRVEGKPFRLYVKTKDVIVAPYDDKIMELLRDKTPNGTQDYVIKW